MRNQSKLLAQIIQHRACDRVQQGMYLCSKFYETVSSMIVDQGIPQVLTGPYSLATSNKNYAKILKTIVLIKMKK
jgi:hypothetical protein